MVLIGLFLLGLFTLGLFFVAPKIQCCSTVSFFYIQLEKLVNFVPNSFQDGLAEVLRRSGRGWRRLRLLHQLRQQEGHGAGVEPLRSSCLLLVSEQW